MSPRPFNRGDILVTHSFHLFGHAWAMLGFAGRGKKYVYARSVTNPEYPMAKVPAKRFRLATEEEKASIVARRISK